MNIPVEGAREKHRRIRKEKFLERATRALAEDGFYKLSMNKLAEKLGVKKVVLYRYFESKEVLIGEVLERAANLFIATDALPLDWWGDVNHEAMRICRDEPATMLILARHAAHDPNYSIYFERYKNVIAERTAERLKKNLRAPLKPPVTFEYCGELIAHFIIEAMAQWLEQGKVSDDIAFVDWLNDSIIDLCQRWQIDPPRPKRGPCES